MKTNEDVNKPSMFFARSMLAVRQPWMWKIKIDRDRSSSTFGRILAIPPKSDDESDTMVWNPDPNEEITVENSWVLKWQV